MMASAPELAYFYPEPYWGGAHTDWVKNLLPFFDGVAILLPRYMATRHIDAAPWLTGPLVESGLLRVLHPEDFIDQVMASELTASTLALLRAGAFDGVKPTHRHEFAELSASRLGWDAGVDLAGELTDELLTRGLALASEDGVSFPLARTVRTAILVILSQLSTARGRRLGLELLPTTPDEERVRDLLSVLALPVVTSRAQVVAADVESVGVDLSLRSLDEVLTFRSEHGESFRSYRANVRTFCRDLAATGPEEREDVQIERQELLRDQAAVLRRVSSRYWRKPSVRVGLGGAGAIMSLAAGQPLAALISSLAAIADWESQPSPSGPFTYLFEVKRALA